MLRIKEFNEKRVVLIDDEDKEYVLTCKKDTDRFDIDIIEDILDWEYRSRHKVGKK